MLTQDLNNRFPNNSPTFPQSHLGSPSPNASRTVVNTQQAPRSLLSFGQNMRAQALSHQVHTPPFANDNIPIHHPLTPPFPPGMMVPAPVGVVTRSSRMVVHHAGNHIGGLVGGLPVNRTTTIQQHGVLPHILQAPGNQEVGIHKEPPADYWDTNEESKRHRFKAGVKKAVSGFCDETCDCCKKFNQLCRPCCPSCGCPWWLEFLIAGLILGALYAVWNTWRKGFFGCASECPQVCRINSSGYTVSPIDASSSASTANTTQANPSQKEILSCNEGYFLHEGKCLSCPEESTWNGTHCTKVKYLNKTITTITNSSGKFVVNADNQTTQVNSHLLSEKMN